MGSRAQRDESTVICGTFLHATGDAGLSIFLAWFSTMGEVWFCGKALRFIPINNTAKHLFAKQFFWKTGETMRIKNLTTPWQRSLGAMFHRHLGDTILLFAYPHPAARLFHTYFCPSLRIIALDDNGAPWSGRVTTTAPRLPPPSGGRSATT